jgi:predicted FMN-binding regulatory protein PaiB
MLASRIFDPSSTDITALVSAHPLALLVSGAEGEAIATPLPLFIDDPEAERLTLVGHFARSNPQLLQLRKDGRALVIFMGPHGYVSPSWFVDRAQAPTWCFACVQMTVLIQLQDEAGAARSAVERLTGLMEDHRPQRWRAAELGERYPRLLAGVVPFRAEVLEIRSKFKLGQNERADVLADMLSGLDRESEFELAAMVRNANAARLGETAAC